MKQLVRGIIECTERTDHVTAAESRKTRRIPCDKFYNEERDHYWCLWWNRRLDRKTSGKRRVCGGGELRRKSSSGAIFSGEHQGCGGTRHRCASRCGDCRRRGAALQRVDGSLRQA